MKYKTVNENLSDDAVAAIQAAKNMQDLDSLVRKYKPSKGDLMKIAYNGNTRNVDAATPKEYWKALERAGGIFWFVMDYQNYRGGKLVHMGEKLLGKASDWDKKLAPYKANNDIKESIDTTPKMLKSNGDVFVNGTFVQRSGKFGTLDHIWMGDFVVRTKDGDVEFFRVNKQIDGISGRVYKLSGDVKATTALIKNMNPINLKESENENESKFKVDDLAKEINKKFGLKESYRQRDAGRHVDSTANDNSLLNYATQFMSAGSVATRLGVSDYKNIDKVRSEIIKILQKRDMPYSISNLNKVIRQAAKAVNVPLRESTQQKIRRITKEEMVRMGINEAQKDSEKKIYNRFFEKFKRKSGYIGNLAKNSRGELVFDFEFDSNADNEEAKKYLSQNNVNFTASSVNKKKIQVRP